MKHIVFFSCILLQEMPHLRSFELAATKFIQVGGGKEAFQNNNTNARSKMYPVPYRECVVSICRILGSIRGTAAIVQPSAASICRWLREIQPKHGASGPRTKMITDLMLLAIRAYLFEKPTTRALNIRQFLFEHYKINVSRQLVQVALSKRLGFTFKRTRKRGPDLSANPEYIARKREYVRELHLCAMRNDIIVSLDESGADERGRPVYGYALRGQLAIINHPPVKVPQHIRTSLLLAIASNGQRFHFLQNGSIDGDIFADFILAMPFPTGSVLLMDNHSIHGTDEVLVALQVKGYRVLYTPPYTPELNPIEMIFGTLKNDYYLERYETTFTTVEAALNKLVDKHGTPTKLCNYIRHVTDMVADMYAHAEVTEGVEMAAIPHATHDVSKRWLGVVRSKPKL
jgi:transposase